MELAYEHIKSLIRDVKYKEQKVECIFGVQGSSKTIRSHASIHVRSERTGRITSHVKSNADYYVRRQVNRFLTGLLGNNMAGRTARNIVSDELYLIQKDNRMYSASQKEEAILEAFRRVKHHFRRDPITGEWSDAGNLSEFSKQLYDHPITDDYDRRVLLRMLIEMMNADGEVSEEEKEIQELLTDGEPVHHDLSLMDSLNYAELEGVSSNAKGSLFMLAATMLIADAKITDDEKSLLAHYANGLGISRDDANRYILLAKKFVLEQAIPYLVNRQALHQFANKIKLSTLEADRVMVEYNKRNG